MKKSKKKKLLLGLTAGFFVMTGALILYANENQAECNTLRSIPGEELHLHPEIQKMIEEHGGLDQLNTPLTEPIAPANNQNTMDEETADKIRIREHYGLTESAPKANVNFDILVKLACHKDE